MAIETAISWTDGTWNPWTGCVEYHEGCANCYARELANRFGTATWGKAGPRVISSVSTWSLPRRCQLKAEKSGKPFLLFTASMADVFENYKGPFVDHKKNAVDTTMDALRAEMFREVDKCPDVVFQLLTKRHERWLKCWPMANESLGVRRKIPNAWVGVSASSQESYDAIWSDLEFARDFAGGAFLSLEPLVGEIDLLRPEGWCGRCKSHVPRERMTALSLCHRCGERVLERAPVRHCDWVIVGGESGPNARVCNERWVRRIVEQCRELGVPCFFKQFGSRPIRGGSHADKTDLMEAIVLRDKKGGDPAEWPEDLRVQQFPKEWRR